MTFIRHMGCLAVLLFVMKQGNATPILAPDVFRNTEYSIEDSVAISITNLLSQFQKAAEESNKELVGEIALQIENILENDSLSDTLLLSDAYYALGYWYLLDNKNDQALEHLSESVRYRELTGIVDRRYATSLSNIAVAFFNFGDFEHAYDMSLRALAAKRLTADSDSSALVSNYMNLASICVEMNDSENAILMAETGLNLATMFPGKVSQLLIADLYQVIGLSLYRTSEYTKSLIYCREALKLYDEYGASQSNSKQLVLNTISQIYRRLDEPEQAEEYFKKGLAFAGDKNLPEKYLVYINYASFLADMGRIQEGEKVLEEGLASLKEAFGSDSRDYCMMLALRADFVHQSTGDARRALGIYSSCFSYLDDHPWDVSLKRYILYAYAETLYSDHQYQKVVEMVDAILLVPDIAGTNPSRVRESLNDLSGSDLNVLLLKYRALNALADQTHNPDYLRQAVLTGGDIVLLYDRQRLEMSEEESRNNLSAFSREFYTGIIDNYIQLHTIGHEQSDLNGAFEYSERSKVAGFLASMRELNAARFSLPPELVELETNIRKNIGFYKELIANEMGKDKPDSIRIVTWESVTFSLLRSRDSLIKVFETSYPAYYSLKFKSDVSSIADVPRVIGKNTNLLSYVLTDKKLFIFITNKINTEVVTRDVDSAFFISLDRFRTMLSVMPETGSARKPFNDYMDLAYELYSVLLEPVVPYLNGDRIIISPDNILSYLPFETLVTEEFRSPELLYREAPFALKKYRFSYIYSVTLSSETPRRSRSLGNDIIAFAPTYTGMEVSDSLLANYPGLRGEISNLPYAIIEAEDAVRQCGGTAFTLEAATEDTYKSEAGKYDIIHLAMHTLVNDLHPPFSKMLFAREGEGKEDGYLNTYEVYNVPLNAMMVVLSSCNTGLGMLATGEGILSLARGFLFAGSRSVVMSMWEVEDLSASTVIKSFYRNMRSGMTKSSALRGARLSYLRSASQKSSHPYYWATLVIYGDDTPLYYNRVKLYLAFLIFLAAAALLTSIVYKGPRS